MEQKNLNKLTHLLRQAYGRSLQASYLTGKTEFRDTLYDEMNLSQVEVEKLVDTLELRHFIEFQQLGKAMQYWVIRPVDKTEYN